MYILTCDVGTTSLKSVLVDGTGRIVSAGAAPLKTEYPSPGWSQQDPAQYLPAAADAIKAAINRANVHPKEIAAIGLSGTMNGMIPVDDAGTPLHPNLIHSDARSVSQCEAIAREFTAEDFYARTGNRIDVHFTMPKAFWFYENYPELHHKTRFILNTKDYLHGCLTGRWGVTDLSDASLTIALNIKKAAWDADISTFCKVDGKQPQILPATDTSAGLTEEAAQALGLLAGTPVAVGAGDGACATRGAGVWAGGQGYACLGSSGWISVLTPHMVMDDRSFHFYDAGGKLLNYCGTVQCVTVASDFMFNLLGFTLDPKGFAQAEELAQTSPPGANGLLFSPTFMGERTPFWDPNLRGSFSGMSLGHTKADFVRAVYEGITNSLGLCLDVTKDNGIAPQSLTLIGGGAKSGLWPKLFREHFGIPVNVSAVPGEATALGASMVAGAGCGLFPSLDEATQMI